VESFVPAFRAGERGRVNGAMWLWVGYLAAAWFPASAAQGGILAGALADPAASIVGSRWGHGQPKSWIGTAAAFVAGSVALVVVGTPAATALGGGVVAAALERWSGPINDNVTIAPGVALFLWLLS
jgi:dolichol kinase